MLVNAQQVITTSSSPWWSYLIPVLLTVFSAYTAWRARKATSQDKLKVSIENISTDLIQQSTGILKHEVDRLSAEQAKWRAQDEVWQTERQKLQADIAELSGRLSITNLYLDQLLRLIAANNITAPPAPAGVYLDRRSTDSHYNAA